jgi:hypothetical protein
MPEYTHIVTTYTRTSQERTECYIVEICAPRSKHDDETHRVQLIGGRVIRVAASQLKAI